MEVIIFLIVGLAIALLLAQFILRGSNPSSYTVRNENRIEQITVPPDCLDVLPEEERLARVEIEIVGESHYQTAIARCRTGERVLLIRQPDNPYDKNAVAVTRTDGAILGYISRDEARGFAKLLDSGHKIYAEIHGIYGGSSDKPSFGIWLDVYHQRKRRKRCARVTK